MAETKTDKYANVYLTEVTMSGIDTLTFEQINIGVSLFDRMGLMIHRIEYIPADSSYAQIIALIDLIKLGIVSSDQIASLSANTKAVIDFLSVRSFGSVDGIMSIRDPIIHSFADLPEGGLLVAPEPLYLAMDTGGFTAVGAAVVRMYYTLKKMSDADYFELLETRRYYA